MFGSQIRVTLVESLSSLAGDVYRGHGKVAVVIINGHWILVSKRYIYITGRSAHRTYLYNFPQASSRLIRLHFEPSLSLRTKL